MIGKRTWIHCLQPGDSDGNLKKHWAERCVGISSNLNLGRGSIWQIQLKR